MSAPIGRLAKKAMIQNHVAARGLNAATGIEIAKMIGVAIVSETDSSTMSCVVEDVISPPCHATRIVAAAVKPASAIVAAYIPTAAKELVYSDITSVGNGKNTIVAKFKKLTAVSALLSPVMRAKVRRCTDQYTPITAKLIAAERKTSFWSAMACQT